MKKKLLCALLAVGIMVSVLSGCSLFATGGGDDETDSEFPPVKITDSYSFDNPEELDFDCRYVVVCDENSPIIASETMAEFGVQGSYSVIYGKEDTTVATYDFYLCGSEEDAAAMLQFYVDNGNTTMYRLEEDALVLCNPSDPDKLEAMLVMFESDGMMSDTSAKSYADFCVTMYGGTLAQ